MRYFTRFLVLLGITFSLIIGVTLHTTPGFAWDFYAYEIADYAEAVYDPNINPDYRAQCAVFVVDILEALTGIRSFGWTSQEGYENGLQNTYGAVQVSLSEVERGDIMTITHKYPGYWVPHIAIVSEYTNGNLYVTESNVPKCYECVRVHNIANWLFDSRWSFNLRFWRVGKSKNEQPKSEGCTDPNAINYDSAAEVDNGSCEYSDDYPTLATFNDKLYQAARRRSDNMIVTRYTEDGDSWTTWQESGQTPDAVSMVTFTPQGKSPRLYQAARGTVKGILTRYTEDGITWTRWELHDMLVGDTPSSPSLIVFNPGTGDRLYLANGVQIIAFTRVIQKMETVGKMVQAEPSGWPTNKAVHLMPSKWLCSILVMKLDSTRLLGE